MKFKYLVVVLSLISMMVLYLIAGLSQPTIVSFSELSASEGKRVVVQGIVAGYQSTTAGSTFVTLRNNDAESTMTITLYVEGQPSLEYGDVVQVTGTVQQYNNQWELAVADPQSISVLERWGNRSLPLGLLAKDPERYVDTNVNVTGIVGSITSTSFELQDVTDGCTVSVTCKRSSNASFVKNDFVAVKARFFYDEATLSYQLKVADPSKDIQMINQG